jgi:hypothetical protein
MGTQVTRVPGIHQVHTVKDHTVKVLLAGDHTAEDHTIVAMGTHLMDTQGAIMNMLAVESGFLAAQQEYGFQPVMSTSVNLAEES